MDIDIQQQSRVSLLSNVSKCDDNERIKNECYLRYIVKRIIRVSSPGRTGIDLVSDIKSAHVIGNVRIEVQQRAPGSSYYFGHAAYVIAVFVH